MRTVQPEPSRSVGTGRGDMPDTGEFDRALEERPSISIRLRIGVSMGLCFLLTAAVTMAWIFSVREVARSQDVLERANRYAFELEQARRYEKNYLTPATGGRHRQRSPIAGIGPPRLHRIDARRLHLD